MMSNLCVITTESPSSRMLLIPVFLDWYCSYVYSGSRGNVDGRVAEVRNPHFWKPLGTTPRNLDISDFFLKRRHTFFAFSNIFQIRWPKSEEKLNFGGRWIWVPMNPTSPNQNFVATPLHINGTWQRGQLQAPRVYTIIRNCIGSVFVHLTRAPPGG